MDPNLLDVWHWEGNVQDALAAHLQVEGWTVTELADTASKAAGVDLLAHQGDRVLAVEVKGFPTTTYAHGPKQGQAKPTNPSTQARHWFSHSLLSLMLMRHSRPNAEIALCLPRFSTYETLIEKTRGSLGISPSGGHGVMTLDGSAAPTRGVLRG